MSLCVTLGVFHFNSIILLWFDEKNRNANLPKFYFYRLSRLSGEPIFEEKAKAAMDVLWASRHRQRCGSSDTFTNLEFRIYEFFLTNVY